MQDAKIDPLEAFDPLVSSEPDAKIDPLGVFDPLVSNIVTKLKRKKKAEGWITKPKITSVKDKIAAMDQFIENLPADGDKISKVQCLPETLLKTVPENVPEIPVKNGFLVDNDSPVKQRPKRRGIIESDDEQESPLTEKLPRRLDSPLADKRPRRLNVLNSEDEESKAFEEKAEQGRYWKNLFCSKWGGGVRLLFNSALKRTISSNKFVLNPGQYKSIPSLRCGFRYQANLNPFFYLYFTVKSYYK